MSSKKLLAQLFLNDFKEAANGDYGILYAGRGKIGIHLLNWKLQLQCVMKLFLGCHSGIM